MVKLHLGGGWACDKDYTEDDIYDILGHPRTVCGNPLHISISLICIDVVVLREQLAECRGQYSQRLAEIQVSRYC